MNTLKPLGSGGRYRPFAHTRHRARYGLMEALRREFGGDPTSPSLNDAMEDLAPTARREIRDRHEGGQA